MSLTHVVTKRFFVWTQNECSPLQEWFETDVSGLPIGTIFKGKAALPLLLSSWTALPSEDLTDNPETSV
jgi:hypothetical protein